MTDQDLKKFLATVEEVYRPMVAKAEEERNRAIWELEKAQKEAMDWQMKYKNLELKEARRLVAENA